MLCAFSKKGVMDKNVLMDFFCLSLPITVKDKALHYEPVEALFMSTNLFSAGLCYLPMTLVVTLLLSGTISDVLLKRENSVVAYHIPKICHFSQMGDISNNFLDPPPPPHTHLHLCS